MKKVRMLLISVFLSTCLAVVAVVTLMFLDENNSITFHSLQKGLDETFQSVAAEQPSEDTVYETKEEGEYKEYLHTGLRTTKDTLGIHDIVYDSGTVAYTATSGPIQLTIEHVRLEQLTPANEQIKNALEGRNPSTVAALNVHVENHSEQSVIFNVDDAKIVADSDNETVVLNPKLSTFLGAKFKPFEMKQGTLMMDFEAKAKPNAIATIQLKIEPAYDKNYDAIGEPFALKVPMF